MQTIYTPKGRALEYAPLALNIYSGCSHGCTYCYMRPMHERFHGAGSFNTPVYREGLTVALHEALDTGKYAGKTVHLCFSCDPYPAGIDTTPTRDVIQLLKQVGCHVQILTKGGTRAQRDFDLLDDQDWFGVTVAGTEAQQRELEPGAADINDRLMALVDASAMGIKTWVSFEPVYSEKVVFDWLKTAHWVDQFRIGKLNHYSSGINWGVFGRECERLAALYGRNIKIKDDLRKEMENHA